ncbi:MAG: hypothetical protein MUE32_10280 [Bacteroidales bacterium]|nr:hypothetical protein [Bacteroidales bacterium]
MKSLSVLPVILIFLQGCLPEHGTRQETSLNGTWELAVTGSFEVRPENYNSSVPVPGLVDMAEPGFPGGDSLYSGSVFWHRRLFKIDDPGKKVIRLKINKARYHTKVFINGSEAGSNLYSFTPTWVDIKPFLNKEGVENEIVIAVGCRGSLPDTVTNGWDFEKIRYIPGIYDDVTLIRSGYPYIENVQIAPDVAGSAVRIAAEVTDRGKTKTGISYEISEAVSGRIIARGRVTAKAASRSTAKAMASSNLLADYNIELENPRLWSPDDPFMYKLKITTGGDSKTTMFGMRSFEAADTGGIFLLNGKPLYMRGTNVCIYRFFEDPERNGLPWDRDWVVKLHQRFREMGWQSIRYCIGFPPEMWYEVADSLGFLIQDEYPLWTLGKENFGKHLGSLNSEQLAAEYTEWMRERWNHPCVVIWDAQNESITDVSGKAIARVRELDLSGRPWDNGWAPPVSEKDAIESHPYLFSRYMNKKPGNEGYLAELLGKPQIPGNDPNSHYPLPGGKRYENPIILNEYGWIWLNRDGSTTTLTDKVYENVFPEAKTPNQRMETYARNLGMLTEYWRSYRYAAAVMHFCGLGYSRPQEPRGQTSDHFIDIRELTFEPEFVRYVKPAFSPLGIMAEFWGKELKAGSEILIPLHVINDTQVGEKGRISLTLLRGSEVVSGKSVDYSVDPLGKTIVSVPVRMPSEKGRFRIEAELVYKGEPVRSIREFDVL